MHPAPSASRNADLRGAGFMVIAMAAFALEDLSIKLALVHVPVGQIMVFVGLCGLITFALMARAQRESPLHPAMLGRAMAIRSGFEIMGRAFYALALLHASLASNSAILQASPLAVMAGAALVLKEPIAPRRWLAVGFGFLGVMVILQPGTQGFDITSLLAVAGMIGFAGRDLATRAAPPAMSNRQLGVIGFAMLTIAGLIVLPLDRPPALPPLGGALAMSAAAICGIFGYHMLTAAMRTGAIAAVAPFRYTRLVFALILAILVLGESLQPSMLIGAAMVVGAGLIGLGRPRAR